MFLSEDLVFYPRSRLAAAIAADNSPLVMAAARSACGDRRGGTPPAERSRAAVNQHPARGATPRNRVRADQQVSPPQRGHRRRRLGRTRRRPPRSNEKTHEDGSRRASGEGTVMKIESRAKAQPRVSRILNRSARGRVGSRRGQETTENEFGDVLRRAARWVDDALAGYLRDDLWMFRAQARTWSPRRR